MQASKLRLSNKQLLNDSQHICVLHQNLSSSQLHSHEFFEIEIVLRGTGTHIINGNEYALQRGMVWICTPADFHEIILDGTAEYWTVVFDETVLSLNLMQALLQSAANCSVLDEETLQRLDTVVQLINWEYQHNGIIQPLMDYLLHNLVDTKQTSGSLPPVKRALLYVETFFRNNPSLTEVATFVGLCPNYFGNLFKREIGEGYNSYLNRRKVTCAMMLLENNMSVARACNESGFGSLSGFLYNFRKVTGISPNEYRKNMLKNTAAEGRGGTAQ